MAAASSVLVVGGNMFLGHLVRNVLASCGCFCRVFDQSPVNADLPGEDIVCGDLADMQQLLAACSGIDTIIDVTKLDAARMDNGNISYGCYSITNLWEAARISGVKRVISVHSSSVVGFYRRATVLDHLSPPRPDGPLGVIGAASEATSSLYACKYGIRALCVRMGDCWREPQDERMLSTWVSPADFERLIRMALSADYLHEIVYGVSANTERWWDNSNARRLGFRPVDKADAYADALRGRRSANSIENAFQGGKSAAAHFAGDARRIS